MAATLVRRLYAARAEDGDPEALRPFLAPGVDWAEPEVGAHMGRLPGAGTVLGMIRRAQATAGGALRLGVVGAVETRTHCAGLVGCGRGLAVFGASGGRVVSARFHLEDAADDQVSWGEAGQGA